MRLSIHVRTKLILWSCSLAVVLPARAGFADAPEAPAAPVDKTVESALHWLAEHQGEDGGWDLDHRQGGCAGRCPNPGQLADAKNSATALALLAILRAGENHQQGRGKESVAGGIRYLTTHAGDQGSFRDGGTLYGHGLATLALCEALQFTPDDTLRETAQKSIDFIVSAQDPLGGGWRYTPKTPGDTSVTGWQLAALCAAEEAELTVPPDCLLKARRFLMSVQSTDGTTYGYTTPGGGAATTAIGHYSQMRLGTKPTDEALQRGVAFIDKMGPSKHNLYYNYYATLLLHATGGDPWERWKKVLQPLLADSQETDGHAAGSWFSGDVNIGADRGGRLYCTTMSLMIYSHLLDNN